METHKIPRWATKAEAAEYARCSPKTIEVYINDGRLTMAGHEKKVLVDLNELDSILYSKQPFIPQFLRD